MTKKDYRELSLGFLRKQGTKSFKQAMEWKPYHAGEIKVRFGHLRYLNAGLNGYALVARLRAKWPKMPVILTTGFLSPDAAKSMMNGSVDFIPKPINAETLLDMVRGRVAPVS